jgi:hypothetical protein
VAAARWLDAEDATLRRVLAWAMQHDQDISLRLTAALAPLPHPGGAGGTIPSAPAPATAGVLTGSGMAGWQITLIAVGAALAGATAAVLLDRARAARRSASATSA